MPFNNQCHLKPHLSFYNQDRAERRHKIFMFASWRDRTSSVPKSACLLADDGLDFALRAAALPVTCFTQRAAAQTELSHFGIGLCHLMVVGDMGDDTIVVISTTAHTHSDIATKFGAFNGASSVRWCNMRTLQNCKPHSKSRVFMWVPSALSDTSKLREFWIFNERGSDTFFFQVISRVLFRQFCLETGKVEQNKIKSREKIISVSHPNYLDVILIKDFFTTSFDILFLTSQ